MIAVILAFSILFISGCSNIFLSRSVVQESEFPPSMTGLIKVNGTSYEMEEGGYRWERSLGLETEMVTTDHASPYQMAEHIQPITLKPNEKVEIKIEEDPDITVYLWNEQGRESEVQHVENTITAPSSAGQYIYEVSAEWLNGTVSYVFVIVIE